MTAARAQQKLDQFMAGLIRRNPSESEFHQAVREVAESLVPFVMKHPAYEEAQILERLTEPDRIITFRVTWQDDAGRVRANRAPGGCNSITRSVHTKMASGFIRLSHKVS